MFHKRQYVKKQTILLRVSPPPPPYVPNISTFKHQAYTRTNPASRISRQADEANYIAKLINILPGLNKLHFINMEITINLKSTFSQILQTTPMPMLLEPASGINISLIISWSSLMLTTYYPPCPSFNILHEINDEISHSRQCLYY